MKAKSSLEMMEMFDPEMMALVHAEEERQRKTIGLIASENVASVFSTFLEGCAFTNKNTEGYPGRRFVGGCEFADKAENLAIQRLKDLLGCEHANIQGANATISNIAVLIGLLSPGDTILSMRLSDGGHLSHGAKFHFSGKNYNAVHYGVSRKDEFIDLDEVRELAQKHSPKIIVCGASSYPRTIDYKGFSDIAKSVGAYLWVDSAHDIGLVAAKAIPSPVPYADIVTFSTQKTLRGPRGCGVILCTKELGAKVDRGLFPGIQGGPKLDMQAARGVLFKECATPEFQAYGQQVVKNAKALADSCRSENIRLITDGTDNHMVVLDVTKAIPSGQEAEDVLNSVGIVTNKNMIPFDPLPANVASGLRIGSPLMTTRGAKEDTMAEIGQLLVSALNNHRDLAVLEEVKKQTSAIADRFPMFAEEWLPAVCK